jgi:AAA15 family ATPase/GTPase
MIKTIEITSKNKTIPKGFKLSLEKMTVITGKNNTGKTNFVETVNSREKETNKLNKVKFFDESNNELKVEPEIIYIKAENIKPSEDALKSTAKTTWLVESLSKLFLNAGLKIKLDKKNRAEIEEMIENIENKTNQNLQNFAGCGAHKVDMNTTGDELDSKLIIQALIDNIVVDENGEKRKLDNLGQGIQRLIVASALKAYLDILVEKGNCVEKQTLIIFEEPEIYLHPELKRTLNSTLEDIAEKENHQIIITTHDSYFAFKNFEGKNKKIVSFEKGDDGLTKPPSENVILGIEDELLFIFLYNLLENGGKNISEVKIKNFDDRIYYRDLDKKKVEEKHCALEYIRHQIHHLGDNQYTLGLVKEKPELFKGKNFYTEKELSSAIREMCKKINEKN